MSICLRDMLQHLWIYKTLYDVWFWILNPRKLLWFGAPMFLPAWISLAQLVPNMFQNVYLCVCVCIYIYIYTQMCSKTIQKMVCPLWPPGTCQFTDIHRPSARRVVWTMAPESHRLLMALPTDLHRKHVKRFLTNWWFQPPWKILASLDHHPNYWGK